MHGTFHLKKSTAMINAQTHALPRKGISNMGVQRAAGNLFELSHLSLDVFKSTALL